MTDPWLRTGRLLLRRPEPDDVRRVFEVHSDPRTYRHLPAGRMRHVDEAIALVAAWTRHWDEHGFGYAVVEHHGGHPALGFAGAKHQHVVGCDVLNLYYRFAPEAWGNGYAVECMRAVIDELAARLPELPVLARAATNNPAVRVAERVGLVRQDVVDPHDPVPHVLLASSTLLPRP